MARLGLIPPTAVMVCAPRDAAEVETILQVIKASYWFACGEGPAACTASSRCRAALLRHLDGEPGELTGR
jgi:hypothetical protein